MESKYKPEGNADLLKRLDPTLEELGAEIGWIPETRMVTYHRETDKRTVSIEMIIGQNQASVNGEPVAVDRNPAVAPEIVNGRTVVPVRFISEALGFEVEWNTDTRRDESGRR